MEYKIGEACSTHGRD